MTNPKKTTFEEVKTDVDKPDRTNTHASLNNGNPVDLHYPSDLGSLGHESYMTFGIRDSVRLFGGSPKTKKWLALYLPATLRVSYGADYEDFTDHLEQIIDIGRDAGEIPGKIADLMALSQRDFPGASSAIGRRGSREAIMQVGRLGGMLSTDIQRKAEHLVGGIVNPHQAVAFTGVPFRKFQFSFQMMARTRDESFSIREIIREFKRAMHPAVDESITRWWLYPDNFVIKLYTPGGGDEFLFEIEHCVLTGLDVDYAGSGVPSFFTKTGAPVDIRMTLSFQEIKVLTRADFEDAERNF